MEELLREWDGENVLVRYDAPSATWIFLAVHDRTLGMALGGCRIHTYARPSDGLRDALNLSRATTLKWAAIGFPYGGGTGVIAASAPLTPAAREAALLRFGEMVESLGGRYSAGEDLGTSARDMDVIGRRTRWVFGRTIEAGGSGDPGPWTALGVFAGIRAACRQVFGDDSLDGRSVLVQGLGSVGRPLVRLLHECGASLLVSDALPARAQEVADEVGARVVGPELVYDTVCDVFAPCAIGGVLNPRSIPRLRCRIVAGSANNQAENDAAADALHEAGILYVPDFVLNVGGAIAHAGLEVLGWDRSQVEARVKGIESTVTEILGEAAALGVPAHRDALRRAASALEEARTR